MILIIAINCLTVIKLLYNKCSGNSYSTPCRMSNPECINHSMNAHYVSFDV